MDYCYEYGCLRPASHRGVERWTLEGARRPVKTCREHTECPVCNKVMEINPISLRIECFSHGRKSR